MNYSDVHKCSGFVWVPGMLGSRCCSMCGRNAASVYGSDVYNRGGKFDVTKLGYHLPSE